MNNMRNMQMHLGNPLNRRAEHFKSLTGARTAHWHALVVIILAFPKNGLHHIYNTGA